jgi:capsular exopolysaccharide synthesis family protein
MAEKAARKNTAKELGLHQLISVLLKKSWLIIVSSILCAALVLGFTYYFVTPKYESSTMFYVNNSTLSLNDVSLSTGDINTRKDLVDSYIVILNSRLFLTDVKDYAGVDHSVESLRKMISASSVNSTEIFEVVVTSPDPYEAKRIARAIEVQLPKRIATIIEGSSAKVVDSPIVAANPSSPSYVSNTIIGFLIGLLLSVVAIAVRELFDVTIREEEDVQQSCSYPVLAEVPDMQNVSKGGYYYRDAQKRPSGAINGEKETVLVGSGISFAASEAYKLLRTKLQFSFVDDHDCHIIGVSSALAGEGKSVSSVNLAYSLAQLEKRVLLVDCDMRRPSLNTKLPIQKVPGLSNYLTRQVSKAEIIQKYTTEECGFDVISSGRNPPNPIELLSSDRMQKALEQFRESYDFIILDLPPVGEVSDALVAAKLVDGILMVVRQNYCNRTALNAAVEQFDFVDTRILGIVLNCTNESSGRYGKQYKGYKRYYNRYEGSYMAANRAARQEKKQ